MALGSGPDDRRADGESPHDWADADLVGRFVARARRIADLSQRELAHLVGIDRSVIGRLESGTRLPSLELLAKILDTADLRLAVVDAEGIEAAPIAMGGAHDRAGRRHPAHHDVIPGYEGWAYLGSVAYAEWQRTPHAAAPRWTTRGPGRDRRRQLRGGDALTGRDDHPSQHEIERNAWLAQRYGRVTVKPRPEPLIECTCFDECFERTCVEACPCQCEC